VISNASKVHICHYLLQNIKICTGDHLMLVICAQTSWGGAQNVDRKKKTTAVAAAASARVFGLYWPSCSAFPLYYCRFISSGKHTPTNK